MTDEVTPGTSEDTGSAGGGAVGRRAVLCGAGAVGAAVLAAGCAGGQTPSAEDLSGKEIAKTADIPVGGGKVYGGDKVVVTQPSEGTFKAFTAVCPHQGCTVDKVQGGLIRCPCHGSEFAIADGAVRKGPAEEPLKEYPVQVKGDGIVVT